MRVRALVLTLLMFACGGRLPAQAAPAGAPGQRGEWLIGGSVGVPGAGSYATAELFTIGLQCTQSRPGRLGGDFAIGTMPLLIAHGIGVVGARGGMALSLVPAPGVVILPSAGFSVIGGAGDGGAAAALAGLNAGVAAIIFGTERTGLRTGVTWHRFQDAQVTVWLIEVGFVTALDRW